MPRTFTRPLPTRDLSPAKGCVDLDIRGECWVVDVEVGSSFFILNEWLGLGGIDFES